MARSRLTGLRINKNPLHCNTRSPGPYEAIDGYRDTGMSTLPSNSRRWVR